MSDSDDVIVYQVINFDREEIFFGTTSRKLDEEIERIARVPGGPAKEWKKGDTVHWRPLSNLLSRTEARTLHRELEKRTPPNKFKVVSTYVPDADEGA